jgi:hypothetical protein
MRALLIEITQEGEVSRLGSTPLGRCGKRSYCMQKGQRIKYLAERSIEQAGIMSQGTFQVLSLLASGATWLTAINRAFEFAFDAQPAR